MSAAATLQVGLATERDVLAEAVLTSGDSEPREHLLARHRLRSFHVVDGSVDGLEQPPRPGEILFERLPMRPEGGQPLKVGPAEDALDLLQLEAQLPVEQDLLKGQELGLLVEAVAIRTDLGGLQQVDLVVEVQRTDAHARHRGDLLDGVRHQSFPSPVEGRDAPRGEIPF